MLNTEIHIDKLLLNKANKSLKKKRKFKIFIPLLAAKSIHVSNEVCLSFTPALTNLCAYLLINTQSFVL